jgi:hypothetical protein
MKDRKNTTVINLFNLNLAKSLKDIKDEIHFAKSFGILVASFFENIEIYRKKVTFYTLYIFFSYE